MRASFAPGGSQGISNETLESGQAFEVLGLNPRRNGAEYWQVGDIGIRLHGELTEYVYFNFRSAQTKFSLAPGALTVRVLKPGETFTVTV